MHKKNGFTLVEILVVIAIIVGLVAMIFPNFTNLRELARDNQRKSDLKQLQKMLEIYKESSTPISYPTTIPAPCASWSIGSVLITNKVPGDPAGTCSSPKAYYYNFVPATDTLRYELYACMENKNEKEATSYAADFPAKFTAATGISCTSGVYYKVVEP